MTDPIVQFCQDRGLALDRETYLFLAYPDGEPEPWTPELEMELPPEFRWDGEGMPPFEISGASLARWAQFMAWDDATRIKTAIRLGLLKGLNSEEIAAKVVGKTSLNGADGVTEITRRRLMHLAQATVKKTKK